MEATKPEEQGPTQEQASAIITEAIEDLQKKLGNGTRIVVMASRGGPGTWGYVWSLRGDSFAVLGLLDYARDKIKAWLATTLG